MHHMHDQGCKMDKQDHDNCDPQTNTDNDPKASRHRVNPCHKPASLAPSGEACPSTSAQDNGVLSPEGCGVEGFVPVA
jgi:hypothetical protein